MKKRSLCLLLLFLFVGIVAPIHANVKGKINSLATGLVDQYHEKNPGSVFKKHLAVLNLKNQSEELEKIKAGETISSLLTTKISESVLFILVEREEINKAFKEISLGQTGLVDEKSAPKAGELLGAEILLDGSVSTVGDQVLVQVRLVSTESGAILSVQDISIPKSEMIAESKNYLDSMFQSKFGISISGNGGMLYPMQGYDREINYVFFDAGYRLFKHLRMGMGYQRFDANELVRKKVILDSQNAIFNYNLSISGVKFYGEGIIPVTRWLNLCLRGEYGIFSDTRLTIDIAEFPVYYPVSATNNKKEGKRILVEGSYAKELVTSQSVSAGFDILISKRLSFNARASYIRISEYLPYVYSYAGHRQWTDDTDKNGTFSELGNYNFSVFPDNGERVKFNLSGFTFALGLSFIF